MTDHWQIIESVLEDERDRHIINGGKAEHRKELDATIAFVREQRTVPAEGELLPCPFCGEKEHIHVMQGNEKNMRSVHCPVCGASGPMQYGDDLIQRSWNRRVQPQHATTVQGQPLPDDVRETITKLMGWHLGSVGWSIEIGNLRQWLNSQPAEKGGGDDAE